MTTTALQQLTTFIARLLVVQVFSGEEVVERCALVTQAKVYWSTAGLLLVSQVQTVSFYLVCCVGVLSVIG
jgi:hypothetical protein